MQQETFIDLTQVLSEGTPFFAGQDRPRITVLEVSGSLPVSGRRSLNNSSIKTCLHCGTHMDAPFHFFGDSDTIDQIALDTCVGQAALVDLRFLKPRQSISVAHFAEYRELIEEVKRVVLHTGWSAEWERPKYFTDFPVLSGEAAELFVSLGVRLVGIDTPSVDHPPFPAHVALLGHGVLILENLTNLASIPAKRFHLTAAPLKIAGRDASPVRAFAQLLS